jgi:hypothetical protein
MATRLLFAFAPACLAAHLFISIIAFSAPYGKDEADGYCATP